MQHKQRVGMGIHPISLQCRKPNTNFTNAIITDSHSSIPRCWLVNMTIVKRTNRDDSAGVKHLPCVLLIPARAHRVNNRACADPLLAILCNTICIRCCTPAFSGLHRY
uniref:Uncharacterized protein n=1 Tax=Arundo donax TaxID=35708 RepID=A0A0A9DYY6_ARUDO